MAKQVVPGQEDRRGTPSPRTVELDLERVRRAVSGIGWGEVRVIIQDGVVVQIERVERQRLR